MDLVSEDEHKRIEKLEENIYSRDFKSTLAPVRPPLSREKFDVDTQWKHDAPFETEPLPPRRVAGSFFKIIVTIAALFFLVSGGLAAYSIITNWNTIAPDKVNISFVGPVSVAAGQELAFDIALENINRSELVDAVLYVDYPNGTKASDDITADYLHAKEELGTVAAGATARRTMRAVLFGAAQSTQEINVTLDYGVKNSNARFKKTKSYEVTVSSAPLSMRIEHVGEAVSGQQVVFSVNLRSNSNAPLTNLILKAEYPFGFTPVEYTPKPTAGDDVWLMPTLAPGEERSFEIVGKLVGEEGDVRAVRFAVGARSEEDERLVATTFLSSTETLTVRKPPLGISTRVNDKAEGDAAVDRGDPVRIQIVLTNNLPTTVMDTKVVAAMSGQIFDYLNVNGGQGFYRSLDRTVTWDKSMVPQLARLEPGDSVNLQFYLTTLPPSSSELLKNGTMKVAFTASGKQATDSGVGQVITSSAERTIRSMSSIGLVARTVYSVGAFKNTGPIPPKVDKPTTYTVILAASAGANDILGAEARATLPSYVEWLGATSPASEVVTWNPDKNEVVWRLGDMSAGTGIAKPPREVQFQVSITPSVSQVGPIPPEIVRGISITGKDAFTSLDLARSIGNLTTALSTDPRFGDGSGQVTR